MAPERVTPDLHQHDAQKQHGMENDNLKKESQQKNNERHNPIVIRANPPEEDNNRARRENISNHDHRENSKVRRI
jgi:hypothetical protein